MAVKKQLYYLGRMQEYDDVFEYYTMIRDEYISYVRDKCDDMNEIKSSYVKKFKMRVDAMAELLGIRSEVDLPANVDKYRKKRTEDAENEKNDNTDEQTTEKTVDEVVVRIPGKVRGNSGAGRKNSKQADSKKRRK